VRAALAELIDKVPGAAARPDDGGAEAADVSAEPEAGAGGSGE
jgi:hypothetical protein